MRRSVIKRRFKGIDFNDVDKEMNNVEKDYEIDFESNEMLLDRVLKNDFKRVYSLGDINKWIMYGLEKGIINKSNDKENIEMLMKWIDLLGKGGKNISLTKNLVLLIL